ncbi:MAG: ATP-binding cassette domain-containing protein [Deltaproteobacteria bacterium]|nr:ATP-binding cassette domain-containing protein [Deltaproteobacteria bacterium]
MDKAIVVSKITKKFKVLNKPPGLFASLKNLFYSKYCQISALEDVSFEVDLGETVGLIGENGAGKTTLLKILTGIIHPDSGEVRCLSYDPRRRQNEFYKKVALLAGNRTQLWWDLTPNDCFGLLASIYDLDNSWRKWAQQLSTLLNVNRILNIQVRKLSLGERMKVELIGALLHKPKMLFLDEPTLGLDLQSQIEIRKFIKEYVTIEKSTVLITSHYMKDIEEVCERILFLKNGQLLFDGSTSLIFEKFGRFASIQFEGKLNLDDVLFLNPELPNDDKPNIIRISEKILPEAIAYLTSMGIKIISIEIEDFTDVMTRFFEKNYELAEAY